MGSRRRDELDRLKKEKRLKFKEKNYGLSKYQRKKMERGGFNVDKAFGGEK